MLLILCELGDDSPECSQGKVDVLKLVEVMSVRELFEVDLLRPSQVAYVELGPLYHTSLISYITLDCHMKERM